jgi:hypothetical protein
LLGLNADEDLLSLARCAYVPLWYRRAFLRRKRLPDDFALRRDEGQEIINRWKNDEMPQWKIAEMKARVIEDRVRPRSAFWAHVQRLVGSTHVAKCLINYGLSNIESLSLVLHEVVEGKGTDVHKNLRTISELPITETNEQVRRDAKWFLLKCKKAAWQLKASGNQSTQHTDWLQRQCAMYNAMRDGRKRKFADLTGNAMREAVLLDVYDSLG